jgi:hypothetical protein
MSNLADWALDTQAACPSLYAPVLLFAMAGASPADSVTLVATTDLQSVWWSMATIIHSNAESVVD